MAGACAGNSVRYQDTVVGKSPGGLVVLGQETGWGELPWVAGVAEGWST